MNYECTPPLDSFIHSVPVFHKLFALYEDWYKLAKKFPKQDRFLIGAKVETMILETLALFQQASNAAKAYKRLPLEQASRNTDMVKIIIRLAHRLKILSNKDYVSIQTQLQEIGKMIGGWLRSLV